MKRRILIGLGVGLVALAAWELPVLVAHEVVFDEPTEAPASEAPELELDGLVDRVLAPSVLADATRLSEAEHERSDDHGAWTVHESRWKLAAGQEAPQVARRLESVLEDFDERLDAYVTTDDELDADLRIYAGKRLVAHLALEPTLGAPPETDTDRTPLVAVVVTGLGHEGGLTETLLASPLPFSVALEPFAPFTLRLSRSAVLHHKEVLVELGEDHEALAALEAVPYASGLLVGGPAQLDTRLLLDRDLYVLDAVRGGESAAVRAARHAGVPVVPVDVQVGDDPGASLQRARHLAALHGEVVVAVDLAAPGRQEVFRWLGEVRDELRVAFVTEVLDLERLGLDAPE